MGGGHAKIEFSQKIAGIIVKRLSSLTVQSKLLEKMSTWLTKVDFGTFEDLNRPFVSGSLLFFFFLFILPSFLFFLFFYAVFCVGLFSALLILRPEIPINVFAEEDFPQRELYCYFLLKDFEKVVPDS